VGYHLREVKEDGGLPRGVNISYSGGGEFHVLKGKLYLPMQLTDCLLVEVVLLLIGLIKISMTKSSFNHPSPI
jgi:hypothetical protein